MLIVRYGDEKEGGVVRGRIDEKSKGKEKEGCVLLLGWKREVCVHGGEERIKK